MPSVRGTSINGNRVLRQRLGLTNFVVPADRLEAKTKALDRRLASGPSVAHRYIKENFNRAAMGRM